jgi:N-acetylglucosaminyldiphosphoundecaprenol N-acetyl-beta-D-mannosaminyltransferase
MHLSRIENERADRDTTPPGDDLRSDCHPVVANTEDIYREVYCILGIPIDVIDMPAVLRCITLAAAKEVPFLISTPNLNFLVSCQTDLEFRESLLRSDLCPADGMPIVWIARLMGIPIKRRIAGSDIFQALKTRPGVEKPLNVFLYGATENVAAAAARKLNAGSSSLKCVGWACPGFGTLDELSQDRFIDKVNSSGADFLMVALGARKGQLWLRRNHYRLRIPVRSHLGVTIHFQAGTVKRAPYALQKLGLEWLWRVGQEPQLWRRYWHDGGALLRLMLTRVLPLAIHGRILRWKRGLSGHNLIIDEVQGIQSVTLRLSGFAVASEVRNAARCFSRALVAKKPIVIDLSRTLAIDPRFLGLLLMVRKQLKAYGADLELLGVSCKLRRAFRLNGAEYLVHQQPPAPASVASPGPPGSSPPDFSATTSSKSGTR